MKKIILALFIMVIFISNVYARSVKSDITTIIKDSDVDVESIAVSIKNVDNGNLVFSINDKMLMNPASVQKILTTPVSVETLGWDYLFETKLYQRNDDCYILKLGADPYLKSKELNNLMKSINKETQRIFIDDSILDNRTWGEGWQWDDDLNVATPKFGSYNLDKNLIKLLILPGEDGQFATITNPSKYPLVFYNYITKGECTKIKVHRDNNISANTLILSGTVSRPTTIYVPVNNLQRYFVVQLSKILEENKIYLKHSFIPNRLMEKDIFQGNITHDINIAVNDVLKNSNNLVSETMFKLAGAKYLKLETGTDAAGIKMFNDYCEKYKLDNSRIRIVDASGVSKNNLVSADFVTEFLRHNKDNKIMEYLPMPGEGTLVQRLLPIKNNLKAKTGTLSDVSSIAGYLTSKTGKKYVFCIMVNDTKLSASDKKMLEDFIIREAYLRL